MIKAQEATRKLDEIGRLKVPKKFARKLEMGEFQQCEITIEFGRICIKKFTEQNIPERPYTGMVRNLDRHGRICIPKEYMNLLKIPTNVKVDIMLAENKIIIFKVE